MSIRFALNSRCCPALEPAKVIELAKELGYDGVEWDLVAQGEQLVDQEEAVRKLAEEAGVAQAALDTDLRLNEGSTRERRRTLTQIKQYMGRAADLGCEAVRVFGGRIDKGETERGVIVALADALTELGDFAAEHGVRVLVENSGALPSAQFWWNVLDLVRHPWTGLAWNAETAQAAGEEPRTSVPMLNTRIALVRLAGAQVAGDPMAKRMLQVLRGIGYDGFISLEWEAEAEKGTLGEPVALMRDWMAVKVDKRGNVLSEAEVAAGLAVDPEEEKKKAEKAAAAKAAAAKAKAAKEAKEKAGEQGEGDATPSPERKNPKRDASEDAS